MHIFNNEPPLREPRSIGDKTLGVDETISEQNKVPTNKIDAMLQRSYKSDTIPPNTRVGDILVEEGLVTRLDAPTYKYLISPGFQL